MRQAVSVVEARKKVAGSGLLTRTAAAGEGARSGPRICHSASLRSVLKGCKVIPFSEIPTIFQTPS
jgi:hypothetical protein